MDSELGAVVDLMARSELHQDWTIADVQRLIVPPIETSQRVFVVDRGSLVAWGSWALMSETAELGYIEGSRKIQPQDWNAGDRLWLIDAIAPFGHARELTGLIRKNLRRLGYKGKYIRFRRGSGHLHRYARAML